MYLARRPKVHVPGPSRQGMCPLAHRARVHVPVSRKQSWVRVPGGVGAGTSKMYLPRAARVHVRTWISRA